MDNAHTLTFLADIIEPSLSGQYGREEAEKVAQECLRLLAMKEPKKWDAGVLNEEGNPVWNWGPVFAETEKEAEAIQQERLDSCWYKVLAVVRECSCASD